MKKLILLFITILTSIVFTKDFKTALIDQLETIYAKSGRLELEIIKMPKVEDNSEVIVLMKTPILSSIANVPVEVKSKLGKQRILVPIRIKVFNTIAVTKTAIKKGDKFSDNNVALAELDIVQINGDTYSNLEDVYGNTASVNIKPNTPLTNVVLKRAPMIKAGDKILAIKIVGNVEVSFDVISKEDGGIGDNIRVVDKNKKLFNAKIINSSVVEIMH